MCLKVCGSNYTQLREKDFMFDLFAKIFLIICFDCLSECKKNIVVRAVLYGFCCRS